MEEPFVLPVGGHEVGCLGQFLGSLDQLTASNHMRVWVIDGHIEPQGLQEDVLVAH